MIKKILLASLLVFGYGLTPSFATQNIPVEYSGYLDIDQVHNVVGLTQENNNIYIAVNGIDRGNSTNRGHIFIFDSNTKRFQNTLSFMDPIVDFDIKNGKIYTAHHNYIRIGRLYDANIYNTQNI